MLSENPMAVDAIKPSARPQSICPTATEALALVAACFANSNPSAHNTTEPISVWLQDPSSVGTSEQHRHAAVRVAFGRKQRAGRDSSRELAWRYCGQTRKEAFMNRAGNGPQGAF